MASSTVRDSRSFDLLEHTAVFDDDAYDVLSSIMDLRKSELSKLNSAQGSPDATSATFTAIAALHAARRPPSTCLTPLQRAPSVSVPRVSRSRLNIS